MKTSNPINSHGGYDEKALLRKRMLALRKDVSPNCWKTASLAAQHHILKLPVWKAANQVILYSPVRGELDTGLLFSEALAAGKQALFPRCIPISIAGKPGCMELAFCEGVHQLTLGIFKILEPDPAVCHAVSKAEFNPDLAIIPGLAFGRKGERLGYGGGYYDRFFNNNPLSGCLCIGFCACFQVVDNLPAEEWDVKVDIVCTENGFMY